MKFFNKIIILAFFLITLFIWFFVSNSTFLDKNDAIVFEQQKQELITTGENNANSLKLYITEYIRILELGANILYDGEELLGVSEVYDILEDIKETGNFASVSINSQKGISYFPDGTHLNLHPLYLERMKEKDVLISDKLYDEYLKEDVISISVPIDIATDGSYYYLNGDLSLKTFSKILNDTFADESVYFYLLDSNMNYISKSESKSVNIRDLSFEDAINRVDFKDNTVADVFASFKTKQSKFCSFEYSSAIENDDGRYVYYLPVGINDWMYWALVPKHVIEAGASLHSKNTLIYLTNVVFILLVTFIVIVIRVLQMSNETKTKQKAVVIFAEQTKKIIFEWDWKKDAAKKAPEYTCEVIGRKNPFFDTNIFEVIHPEDMELMQSAFEKILRGKDTTSLVIRLKQRNSIQKEDEYIWFSFSTAILKSKKGKLLKAYGFLENINSTLRHTERLKQDMKKDPLTKLYNKVATEELITELLHNHPENKSALFFIDFDNFKKINDTFGHIKGDEVLKTVTKGLQSVFRYTDVVGRIGGDEFIVFLSVYESIELLRSKAQLLCDSLRKTYREGDVSLDVTFSIGIALAPEHGTDYNALVGIADKALYTVKDNGKNGYKIAT